MEAAARPQQSGSGGSTVKTWWFRGDGFTNFGDELSRYLPGLFGLTTEYAAIEQCDLICGGSVLEQVLRHRQQPVTVWGAGFLHAGVAANRDRHTYRAVRGKLTAARLPHADIATLGDPGLLAADLIPAIAVAEPPVIGLIPHYVDRGTAFVSVFSRLDHVRLIDVGDDPLAIIRSMAGCSFIVSSSLHGLIVADSLGIPNAWLRLSPGVLGGAYKFKDYYSVFGIVPEPIGEATLIAGESELIARVSGSYERPGIAQIKRALRETFPSGCRAGYRCTPDQVSGGSGR